MVGRTVKSKMEDGEVRRRAKKDKELKAGEKNKVIVLASGNLAHIFHCLG